MTETEKVKFKIFVSEKNKYGFEISKAMANFIIREKAKINKAWEKCEAYEEADIIISELRPDFPQNKDNGTSKFNFEIPCFSNGHFCLRIPPDIIEDKMNGGGNKTRDQREDKKVSLGKLDILIIDDRPEKILEGIFGFIGEEAIYNCSFAKQRILFSSEEVEFLKEEMKAEDPFHLEWNWANGANSMVKLLKIPLHEDDLEFLDIDGNETNNDEYINLYFYNLTYLEKNIVTGRGGTNGDNGPCRYKKIINNIREECEKAFNLEKVNAVIIDLKFTAITDSQFCKNRTGSELGCKYITECKSILNGFLILKNIWNDDIGRRIPEWRNLPIIILSGAGDNLPIVQSIRNGVDMFIFKNTDPKRSHSEVSYRKPSDKERSEKGPWKLYQGIWGLMEIINELKGKHDIVDDGTQKVDILLQQLNNNSGHPLVPIVMKTIMDMGKSHKGGVPEFLRHKYLFLHEFFKSLKSINLPKNEESDNFTWKLDSENPSEVLIKIRILEKLLYPILEANQSVQNNKKIWRGFCEDGCKKKWEDIRKRLHELKEHNLGEVEKRKVYEFPYEIS